MSFQNNTAQMCQYPRPFYVSGHGTSVPERVQFPFPRKGWPQAGVGVPAMAARQLPENLVSSEVSNVVRCAGKTDKVYSNQPKLLSIYRQIFSCECGQFLCG